MKDKDICKRDILKVLKELEGMLEDAERDGYSISEINNDLMYFKVFPFSEALSKNSGKYSSSTARNAINELEASGEISRSRYGFFEIAISKDISKMVKYNMFITLLPVQNQNQGTYYMEVPNNSAQFLADLFNQSVSRNDKRFYAIAHNLLLMLDLELTNRHNILEKKPFDLKTFIKEYGITVRDYETIINPIEGFTDVEIEEQNFSSALMQKQYEKKQQENYSGKVTRKRKLPIKHTGNIDTE